MVCANRGAWWHDTPRRRRAGREYDTVRASFADSAPAPGTRARPRTNRDWWPNQLDLTVLRTHSADSDRVYVFGFSCSAYVDAGRASASRFFWSRPVIVGFNANRPGYGAAGVLDELTRHNPAVVALQRKDWAPDVADSAEYFMATPILAGWLESHYTRADGPEAFDVWVRETVSR